MVLQVHQHLVQSIKRNPALDPIHFDARQRMHLEFKDAALAVALDFIDDAGGSDFGRGIWRRRERRPLSWRVKSKRRG